MSLEDFRAFCLSLPGATEQVQWGSDLLFKVGGKMFAITGFKPDSSVGFKCDPETFAELIEREGIIPAPYLARHNWVSCKSGKALSSGELKKYIRASYDLVVTKLPKRVREGLGS